jgi:DNA-binding NarL/FixJ family response regulator
MKRILLIDDHSAFREGLGQVLTWEDFDEDHHARSGTEGIESLAHLDGIIDVTVVGLDLPGAPGPEWVRKMRGADPGMPILVLAKSSEREDLQRLRELGVEEVLTKDASLEQIVGAIRRLAGA